MLRRNNDGKYLNDDSDENVFAVRSFLGLSSLFLFMNLFSTSSKSSSMSFSIVRVCRTTASKNKECLRRSTEDLWHAFKAIMNVINTVVTHAYQCCQRTVKFT